MQEAVTFAEYHSVCMRYSILHPAYCRKVRRGRGIRVLLHGVTWPKIPFLPPHDMYKGRPKGVFCLLRAMLSSKRPLSGCMLTYICGEREPYSAVDGLVS